MTDREALPSCQMLPSCQVGVDLVTRNGGEESAILLPQTGANGAYTLAERIRRAVEAHPFCEPQNLAVTISIGCTSFTQDTMTTAEQVVKDRGRRALQGETHSQLRGS